MSTLPRCSLDDALASRDRRLEWQQRHFSTSPAATLVVATVVAPGEYKLTPETSAVADAMAEALESQFGERIITISRHAFVSGHEIWLTLSCPADEAKREAVAIEDNHPLGRLFDIDVILPELRPLGRGDIAMAPRRCLLCDNEARFCMRARRHTPGEIRQHIENLIQNYLNGR